MSGAGNLRNQYGFKLQNPQIVNGCQTINSIAEVLSHCNEEKIYDEYAKTFVLVKIYVFDSKTKKEKKGLDKNIVKYTNSQNGIDEKAFASKKNYFKNIQNEFQKRGLLLLVKPSDKNRLSIEYKDKGKFAELRKKSLGLFELFDIDNMKLNNYMIPLEKLLKVLLAFDKNGYIAFTKGSSVLKLNSTYYKEFSLNIDQLFTIDNMIKLYFLFTKAEIEKKNSNSKRMPISYYVLGFLGREFRILSFSQKNEKLKMLFSNKQTLNVVYDFYNNLTPAYAEEYWDVYKEEYNKMIKQEIDELLLDKLITQSVRFAAGKDILKKFFKKPYI